MYRSHATSRSLLVASALRAAALLLVVLGLTATGCGGGGGSDTPPPALAVSVRVQGSEVATLDAATTSTALSLQGPIAVELASTRPVAWTADAGGGPVTVSVASASTTTAWKATLGLPAEGAGAVTLSGVAQDGAETALSVTVALTDGRAYYTGAYRNLFVDVLGKTEEEVQTKIDDAFALLFSTTPPADPADAQLYVEVEPDMAYIRNTWSNGGTDVDDVRSEGMSYGMMIAVQRDDQPMFDRLWKWSKTYMQHQDGALQGYFAWQMNTDGTAMDENPAPDGEEWYATALFMASNRWGDGDGIYDYSAEAQLILDTALHKEEQAGHGSITNMFDEATHQILFQPLGDGATFTDPSYHLPAFYELWARWADKDQAVWCATAAASRAYFPLAADDETGLSPDYARFDGTPFNPSWSGTDHSQYRADAQRVQANIGVDQLWFHPASGEAAVVERVLAFLRSDGLTAEGVATYCNSYTLDGTCLSGGRLPPNDPATFRTAAGHVAMNAVAVHAAADPADHADFVQSFWDVAPPSGKYQYYGKMLYMLGLLEASGQFRVYGPDSGPVSACE